VVYPGEFLKKKWYVCKWTGREDWGNDLLRRTGIGRNREVETARYFWSQIGQFGWDRRFLWNARDRSRWRELVYKMQ
jgi:hypothetical protein